MHAVGRPLLRRLLPPRSVVGRTAPLVVFPPKGAQPSHAFRSYASSAPSPGVPSPGQLPDPSEPEPSHPMKKADKGGGGSGEGRSRSGSFFPAMTSSPALDAALTTVVGLMLVFGSGTGYLAWYKYIVLKRMEKAFEPGYDPAIDLTTTKTRRTHLHRRSNDTEGDDKGEEGHIVREEQEIVDRIVRGEESGSYFMLMGSKGTGKGTMLLDAMRVIQADGAAFVEAHPDLEVFRLRFGKALNHDYQEDSQNALFSRADPRSAGPSLDVERACSKLEKVGLRYARRRGRPLVLIFNNIHLFPNDEEGRKLLHQLQQRAEAWAEAGIVTCVFSSDDFWPYDMMRKNASRMRILSVYDLPHASAVRALALLRKDAAPSSPAPTQSTLEEIVKLIGGRTSYLTRVARAFDMLEEARFMVRSEREWLMSQIGLIQDCDDDVMDEQKWCSCSWLLLRELASSSTLTETPGPPLEGDPTPVKVGPDPDAEEENVQLGYVTYGQARVLMTRADFIQPLDHLNIISIDINHHVRPDSHVTLNAIRSIVSEEGFDDLLDSVRGRIDDIESLHRTREVMLKEPIRVRPWRRGRHGGLKLVGLGPDGVDEEAEDGESTGSGWGWPWGSSTNEGEKEGDD